MSHRAKTVWLLSLIFTMVFMVSGTASAAMNKSATKPISVYVQDKLVKPTVAPIVKNGRIYVEFRSVIKALGFSFNYDAAKQVITAKSEDASFKIELKTGRTYVNGNLFEYDRGVPMIIASGANTLVMGHLFHATNYLYADYYSDTKIVKVYEDPWGMPKKSDVRTIQSVIQKHYADAGASSVTNFQLKSWGSYVTMTADAAFPKSGNELLARIEHASIEMERGEGGDWTIHDIQSDIEYVDYTSLADKEVAVPETDRAAIQNVLTSTVKALNEKDGKAYAALLNPDALLEQGVSKEELELFYQYQFLHLDFKTELEDDVIVAYQQSRATVYDVRLITVNTDDTTLTPYRQFALIDLVKASDGKWYLDPGKRIILDLIEVVEGQGYRV